jgi:hypothetical protein
MTPSRSTADHAPRCRHRQTFLGRDPFETKAPLDNDTKLRGNRTSPHHRTFAGAGPKVELPPRRWHSIPIQVAGASIELDILVRIIYRSKYLCFCSARPSASFHSDSAHISRSVSTRVCRPLIAAEIAIGRQSMSRLTIRTVSLQCPPRVALETLRSQVHWQWACDCRHPC